MRKKGEEWRKNVQEFGFGKADSTFLHRRTKAQIWMSKWERCDYFYALSRLSILVGFFGSVPSTRLPFLGSWGLQPFCQADPNQSPFMQEFFDKVHQSKPMDVLHLNLDADFSSQKEHGSDTQEHGSHGKTGSLCYAMSVCSFDFGVVARDGPYLCFKFSLQ